MADSVVPAGEVSDLFPFKPHPLKLSDGEELNHCRVTDEGRVLLMSCGPRHHSYAVRTGCLKTTWGFGCKTPCVTGPWVYMQNSGRYYTVVAVHGKDGAPDLLCVCQMGKTLKAIRIPAPATHICVVDVLADCPAGFMRGCVAVSTEDAQIFLMDLCLGQETYSSEEYPVPLKFLEGAPPSGSAHCAIFVFNRESFLENDRKASLDHIDVTCLEYLSQLRCLAVGLSTGAIHLWSLLSGCSILALKKSPIPVVALMLQEPENDPRRWCYLWVISGAKGSQRATSMTTCAMFSLDFAKKSTLDSYKFLYEGLTSCHQVLELTLGPNMTGLEESPNTTSRLISCRTMLQAEIFGTGNTSVHTTDRQHDLNLMLLSWELLQGTQSLGTYLIIFDMNQWYQAQMPPVYWCQNGHLSSYMGVFSLEEAVHGSSKVLDVHVVPRSVTKFHSTSATSDQQHFPSALACKCVCVTERGIVNVTFLGLQRQLFQNLDHWGPSCLLSPKELYLRCCHLGLLSQDLPSLDQFVPSMQKVLLGMALDNRLKGFLLSCVKQWAQDEDNRALSFFINWSWERVKEDKATIDLICGPLFDCLGQELSQDSLQRLIFINKDLKVLLWLFKHCANLQPAEVNLDIMDLRCQVVERVEEYVAILLFLINCGVLPDRAEVSYPGTFLTKWYQSSRTTSPPLLIDSIMETVLGGAPPPWGGPYPPPTIQEALTVSFLMHGLPGWGPRVLMLYSILDLASALMESRPHVVEALKAFPIVFKMSNSLQWFVQGCWHLDHSLYEKGLDQLLQAWENPLGFSSLLEALKQPIVGLLSARNRPRLALRFISRVPFPAPHADPELLSLHLGVLLADRRVSEALSMVRRSGQPSDLKYFFERVISISNPEFGRDTLLRILLEYPLSPEEESMLECILQHHSRELAVLALHWLRAGRTQDATRVAVALHDSLKHGTTRQVSGVNPMYAAVLALVQSFAELVPCVSRLSSCRVATQEVCLPSPMQVLPKEVFCAEPSRLRFALGSSTSALQPRQDTCFRRQNVMLFPRPRDSEPPKVTERIQRRKSCVTPTVLADALSVLHTPRVKCGSSLQEVPHTPPPSILKSRPLSTTPVLPEGSTLDGTSRKLRFAVIDCHSVEMRSADLDSQMDEEEMPSDEDIGTPCLDLQVTLEDQSRLSFVTAEDESSDDANFATERYDAQCLVTAQSKSSRQSFTIAQHSLRELHDAALPSTSVLSAVDCHSGDLPEDVEGNSEVEKIACAESTPKPEAARTNSSEKIEIDPGQDDNFLVATPRKETEAPMVMSSADQHDDGKAPRETPLVEELPMYIPGMPTSQDVFDVLHSVVPVSQYDKAAFSSSLNDDYLLLTNVDPRSLSPVCSKVSPSPKRDDSEGTPLKEPSKKRLSPQTNRDVRKILFESGIAVHVAPTEVDEAGKDTETQPSCKEVNIAGEQLAKEHHILSPEDESEKLNKESPVRLHSTQVMSAMGTSGVRLDSHREHTSADNKDNELTTGIECSDIPCDRKRVRCKSEEPSIHRTTRRFSEASDVLMFAEMGSRSERSLPSSDLVSELDERKMVTRRRSSRLLDISARQALSPKLSEKPVLKSAERKSHHNPENIELDRLRSRKELSTSGDQAGSVESEAHKMKKTPQSPSRKSQSQPQLDTSKGTADETHQRTRTTLQRRARSEELSDVTVRRKRCSSLADNSEFEQDSCKTISTSQSSKKERQSADGTQQLALDIEKADTADKTVQHFVQKREDNLLKSISKTASKKPGKTSAGQRSKSEDQESLSIRKTPKKQQQVETAQHSARKSRIVVDQDKYDLPARSIPSKKEIESSLSTTLVSPTQMRTRKRDSPPGAAESGPQHGVSCKGQLETIPEDSENVATVLTVSSLSRTPKTSARNTPTTRRRSMRLLETIPEGPLTASRDNEVENVKSQVKPVVTVKEMHTASAQENQSSQEEKIPSRRGKRSGNLGSAGNMEQRETENVQDISKDSRGIPLKKTDSTKKGPVKKSNSKMLEESPPKEKQSPTRRSPRIEPHKRGSPGGLKRKSEETKEESSKDTEEEKLSASKRKGHKSVKETASVPTQATDSAEDTFKLSAPAYLGDKSAVVLPEAESKIFIFSPPLTRYRSSFLPEPNVDVFKKPQLKEEKSDGIKLVAPLLSPPPARQESKRRRSSATVVSTKLVNTIKRRSLRLPSTPRRLSHGSPGSPWTVIKPKESET